MPKRVAVEQVISMIQQSYADSDIIAYFRDQGYDAKEINDAINQARIKLELAETAGEEYESEEAPVEEEPLSTAVASPTAAQSPAAPAPMPAAAEPAYAAPETYAYPAAPQAEYYPAAAQAESTSVEAIEEIAEGIISEKWEEFKEKTGDVSELRSYMESRLNELNDRVKRLEIATDRLHAATLARVEAQGKSVKTLSSEVQALGGTLGKIMQPLVGSVKELREVTKEMKKVKTAKGIKAAKAKKK